MLVLHVDMSAEQSTALFSYLWIRIELPSHTVHTAPQCWVYMYVWYIRIKVIITDIIGRQPEKTFYLFVVFEFCAQSIYFTDLHHFLDSTESMT